MLCQQRQRKVAAKVLVLCDGGVAVFMVGCQCACPWQATARPRCCVTAHCPRLARHICTCLSTARHSSTLQQEPTSVWQIMTVSRPSSTAELSATQVTVVSVFSSTCKEVSHGWGWWRAEAAASVAVPPLAIAETAATTLPLLDCPPASQPACLDVQRGALCAGGQEAAKLELVVHLHTGAAAAGRHDGIGDHNARVP